MTTDADILESNLNNNTPATAERLTLHKSERLHHHSLVEALFRSGESVYAYPLRMFWRICSQQELLNTFHGYMPPNLDRLQMMITVPKKKFKHAVDRVWLRRRIREAYRLNRLSLKAKLANDPEKRFLQLAFIYAGDEKRDYASIEKKMIKLLDKAVAILFPISADNSTVSPEQAVTANSADSALSAPDIQNSPVDEK